MSDVSPSQDPPRQFTEAELKTVTRDVAQCVKRPDVGVVLETAEALDPMPRETKRKRIAAALAATQAHEGHGGVVERLMTAAAAYDEIEYGKAVARAASHVVGYDRITVVGQAMARADRRIEARSEPVTDGAFVGLTHWGGTSDRLPRAIVLLVREGSRETQVELDADGAGQLIAALAEARRLKADGTRYLGGSR